MFREEQEELTRLQEALLEESEELEETEDLEEEAEDFEEEYQEESEESEEFEEQEKGVTGLLITALLLTLGIVGVAIWVLLEYGFL